MKSRQAIAVLCAVIVAALFPVNSSRAEEFEVESKPLLLDLNSAIPSTSKDVLKDQLQSLIRGEVLSIDEISRLAMMRGFDADVIRLDNAIEDQEYIKAKSLYDTELKIIASYEIDETQPASTIFGSRNVTGDVTSTMSKHLPVGTDVTLSHNARRESTQSPFASLPRLYKSGLSIGIVQPLLENGFGNIDRAKLKRVELDVKKFDYETSDRLEKHLFDVRAAYWDLALAFRDLAAKNEHHVRAEAFLKTMRDKLVLGLVESKDMYAAEANVHFRLIEVQESAADLKSQQEKLQVMLDLPIDMSLTPHTVLKVSYTGNSVDEEVARAMENRRDLKQLKLDITRSDRELIMRRSGLLPSLNFEASYASNGLDRDVYDAQGEIGGLNHPTIFAGLTLSMPLENREARALHAQAQFIRRQIEVRLKQLPREIEQQTRQAHRDVRVAAIRVKLSEQASELQLKKLVAEATAFEQGRSDSRTVIDFQEDWINAESAAQAALIQLQKSIDRLYRTENALLEFAGLTESVQ